MSLNIAHGIAPQERCVRFINVSPVDFDSLLLRAFVFLQAEIYAR